MSDRNVTYMDRLPCIAYGLQLMEIMIVIRLSGICHLSAHACVQGILSMPYIRSHKHP